MAKLLSGRELVDYIKAGQLHNARGLRQAENTPPKLAILQTTDDPVIDTYVRLKKRYGEDVEVSVDVYKLDQKDLPDKIVELNADNSVHGMIVQLPLADPSQTDEIVNLIAPEKDVDGLGENAKYYSATAEAITWLLAGYGVELEGKKIALLGRGRLVGGPLARIWQEPGYDLKVLGRDTKDIKKELLQADVIVTATGVPGIVKSDMVSPGAVVVDAGTAASEDGVILGDVAPDIYERDDISITPQKGGVGPLTIAVLIDHVLRAARAKTKSEPRNK